MLDAGRHSQAPPERRDDSLSVERALVDRARAAVARGRASEALVALDEHAHDFPSGQLAEEREALAIQALAQAGRRPEAVARGATFRRRWPSSMLMPIVEAALR